MGLGLTIVEDGCEWGQNGADPLIVLVSAVAEHHAVGPLVDDHAPGV